MPTKIIPVTDLRHSATRLLHEIKESGGPVYITHRSRPQGVLLGYESYEALLTRLRDLEALCATRPAMNEEDTAATSRFAGAEEFTRKLIANNRSLFEELAR